MKLWNLMDGEISWAALPWIAEAHGCDDLLTLTKLLVTIRNHGKPLPERQEG